MSFSRSIVSAHVARDRLEVFADESALRLLLSAVARLSQAGTAAASLLRCAEEHALGFGV